MKLLHKFDLINNMPNLEIQIFEKISTKNALIGGCLLKPQSKLLPQASASIVSRGKLLFVKDGINIHKNKWVERNK